jgi:hypothetical protein
MSQHSEDIALCKAQLLRYSSLIHVQSPRCPLVSKTSITTTCCYDGGCKMSENIP